MSLSIIYFDPDKSYQAYRTRKRKHNCNGIKWRLKNVRDEGLIYKSKVNRKYVSHEYLGEKQEKARFFYNVNNYKYLIFFQRKETFERFFRIAYFLGEPLWMIVHAYLLKQKNKALLKVFWKVKKNLYAR